MELISSILNAKVSCSLDSTFSLAVAAISWFSSMSLTSSHTICAHGAAVGVRGEGGGGGGYVSMICVVCALVRVKGRGGVLNVCVVVVV